MKRIITASLFLIAAVTAWGQALPFTAYDSDPVSLINGRYFPSGIPFSGKSLDADIHYTMWQPNGTSRNIIGAGVSYNIKDKFGASLKFSTGKGEEYQIIDANGVGKGTYKPSDMKIGAGFAWRPVEMLSIGAEIGYASEKLAEGTSYGSMDIDVSATFRLKSLSATLGVSEIGGKIKSLSGAEFQLPTAAVLDIGYGITCKEKHLIEAGAGARYYFAGDFAATVRAGYTYNDLFSLKAGYRYGGQSVIPSYTAFGAGLKLMGITLDLAYLISSGVMSNTLSLSLGYCF